MATLIADRIYPDEIPDKKTKPIQLQQFNKFLHREKYSSWTVSIWDQSGGLIENKAGEFQRICEVKLIGLLGQLSEFKQLK